MGARAIPERDRPARLTLIGSRSNETNRILLDALPARGVDVALVSGVDCVELLEPGDLALVRLDVLQTLDGVEPGLAAVARLQDRGVQVLNRAAPMLAAHDKLRTASVLTAAGLPHPRTRHVVESGHLPDTPCVLKPRFGSWGRDVFRCANRDEAEQVLAAVSDRHWFRRHGALVQELLPASGYDLRLIVAGGEIVGATKRFAAPGEWRTNVSLGGSKGPVDPPAEARALACAAAAAIGADLIGVDLFPLAGGYTILELNGAVEFDRHYSIPGRDIHDDLVHALRLDTNGGTKHERRHEAISPSPR
jgi:[lysine-biosynthesis-protein LysW]--L-2-aminoadipate ligase